jgi:hypothetical protein
VERDFAYDVLARRLHHALTTGPWTGRQFV